MFLTQLGLVIPGDPQHPTVQSAINAALQLRAGHSVWIPSTYPGSDSFDVASGINIIDCRPGGLQGRDFIVSTAVGMGPIFSPDAAPLAAGSLDDEFPGASLSGAWTQTNLGSTAIVVGKSFLQWAIPGNGAATTNWRRITKPTPVTPWEVTAKLSASGSLANTANNALVAVGIEDNSGKIITFDMFINGTTNVGGTNNMAVEVVRWTNQTTLSAISISRNYPGIMQGAYLRIKDDGVNLTYSISFTGIGFVQIFQESRTAFLAAGPTLVGLYTDPEIPAANSIALDVDWFRKTL